MSADQNDPRDDFERRVDAIESGYEFLLAYAAQGRETDRGPGSGQRLRELLEGMRDGFDGLGALVAALVARSGERTAAEGAAFVDAIGRDAATAGAAIRLVLAQEDISSQLVDNLNASIHVRAVLTDIFIIDELLKKQPQPEV